jgi:hypothetical protein
MKQFFKAIMCRIFHKKKLIHHSFSRTERKCYKCNRVFVFDYMGMEWEYIDDEPNNP